MGSSPPGSTFSGFFSSSCSRFAGFRVFHFLLWLFRILGFSESGNFKVFRVFGKSCNILHLVQVFGFRGFSFFWISIRSFWVLRFSDSGTCRAFRVSGIFCLIIPSFRVYYFRDLQGS